MNCTRITSASNPVIKEIRSLADKRGRLRAQAMLLEGLRLVSEAVDSGAKVRYFVACESYIEKSKAILAKNNSARVIVVPDELFSRLGETQTPQGLMAVCELPSPNEADILGKANRLIVLENVQDPGNVGTIIRTADACGFDAVVLSKKCADPFSPKVSRSTMGSIFHLPVLVANNLPDAVNSLKTRRIRIVSAHPREALPCWQADLSKNIAIIIGNEGNGLSEEMLAMSDEKVLIPMEGRAESLNASVAAAMLLYESMRQNRATALEKYGVF